MIRKTLAIVAISLVMTGGAFAATLSLEPCINAGVSADGMSPTGVAVTETN